MATITAARTREHVPSSGFGQHNQTQVTILQQENQALRQSLARMRNEYEELQEDSKFHQAKVTELSELLMSKNGRGKTDHHERLIQKTQENAELNIKIQSLQAKLKQYDSQLESMNREKHENKRLLLEMSDIVRTLQSVQISYDTSAVNDSANPSYIGAQQQSIKKIKMKIEAIMSDRSLLVRRCKELEKERSEQEHKIRVLEMQFHSLNNANLAKKGVVPMDDAATLSTSYTISTKQSGSAIVSPFHSPHGGADDEDASMNSSMDHLVLKSVEQIRQQHEEELKRMQQENTRVCEQMDSLKEQLRGCKEEMEDAVIKRDEYKETLRDIIIQYKELHAEHVSANEELKQLQSEVGRMTNEEPREEEMDVDMKDAQMKEQGDQQSNMLPRMSDVLAAYNRALDKIAVLEDCLSKAQGQVNLTSTKNDSNDRNYRDAVNRYKKMENERNHFQLLLDKAKEETRRAKSEAQKEREEAKHVRRRLTSYLQNKYKNGTGTISILTQAPSKPMHPLTLPELKSSSLPKDAAEQIKLERDALLANKQRLEKENMELTNFCQEMLKEIGA